MADLIDCMVKCRRIEEFQGILQSLGNVAKNLLYNQLRSIISRDVPINRICLPELGGKRNLKTLQPAESKFFTKSRNRNLRTADTGGKLRDGLLHHLIAMFRYIIRNPLFRTRHVCIAAAQNRQWQ